MWQESSEQNKPLRTGLTTGTCATACSVASAMVLLGQQVSERVSVTLPKGKIVELDVTVHSQTAHASTVKDAGDDPDITHGATIWAEVSLQTQPGVIFRAGEGVGMVTKAGLSLEVGEPAINPVPRQMITENLQAIAERFHYAGGFHVTIGVENGENLAQKTMNPRLGILGGLSILGTTGIVRPFSCAAWIASIHQSIDVASANGMQHVAASTGNLSEKTVKDLYQLDDMALIEMGDFAGAVLKHLKKKPVAMLTLCGGFGKISKLANGNMDLHSRVSSIDFQQLSQAAANAGASKSLQEKILNANTSIEALQLCQAQQINLGNTICKQALTVCLSRTNNTKVNILAVDRKGNIVGQAASVGFGIK